MMWPPLFHIEAMSYNDCGTVECLPSAPRVQLSSVDEKHDTLMTLLTCSSAVLPEPFFSFLPKLYFVPEEHPIYFRLLSSLPVQ